MTILQTADHIPAERCILPVHADPVLVMMLLAAPAAQSWQPPADAQRCPSKWGAGDQRGSGNHMKPETVLRAAKLIRTGESFELGHVLSASMPFFGTRRFELHTKRTNMNPGTNRRGTNEEIVLTEIGQVGTQFDGFSHHSSFSRSRSRVAPAPRWHPSRCAEHARRQ